MPAMLNVDHWRHNRWYWLLGGAIILLFFRLGASPIYILDEAKNAQCAREMWASGNWVVPTFNGELRTDKPALHYWFMAISYSLFGVGAWQARLFSALAGIATLLITYRFVTKWLGKRVAFWTCFALAASTHFLFEFRLSVPDPYLICFTTLGLFAGFTYFNERKWKWLLLSAGSLAMATLAKGPVALALPCFCLFVYLLVNRQWKSIADARLLVAALFYLLLAVPWYLAVHTATEGAFTKGFFLDHNLNRFSSEMEGHGGIFLLVPLFVLIGMLPLMTIVVEAIRKKNEGWLQPLFLFAGVVFLVYLVFFSLSSTKLPNYPMPCYPFAAVLLGWFAARAEEGQARWPGYARWILIGVGFALAVVGYFALRAEPDVSRLSWMAGGILILPAGLLFCKQPIGGKVQGEKIFGLTYFLFNLYFLAIAYPAIYRLNPVSQLSENLNAANQQLVGYRNFNPAVLFNHPDPRLTIPVVQEAEQLKGFCDTLQRSGIVTMVITRKDHAADLEAIGYEVVAARRDLFELPTTVLMKCKH